MYGLSLALSLGWIALGSLAALWALTRRITPLVLSLVVGAIGSLIVDFSGGSIAAMAVLPLLLMGGTFGVAYEVRKLFAQPTVREIPPVLAEGLPSPEDAVRGPVRRVLLLRPQDKGSKVWLAHDGRGVLYVTPTRPEHAKSGYRVGLLEQPNGELVAIT